MKIVLVHNSYQQAGGEDVVVAQERRCLERAGHEVVFYSRSNAEIEALAPVQKLILPKDVVWSSRTRREFTNLLIREAPDLVHIHNTFAVISPSIYSACRERGVPVVQTLHNFRWMCPSATFFRDGAICEECSQDGLWRSVCHGCYRGSRPASAAVALMLAAHRLLGTWRDSVDTYVALTSFSRAKFIAAGLTAEKIVVKPNFVDPDPGPRERAGGYALYVGRLSEEKGLSVLLRAWDNLPAHRLLHVVGDGPERLRAEAGMRQRAASNIVFHGSLPRDQTIALVKEASFLVVPSLCYEGFPMVIAEAMACGTPVICSRLGAMAEIVADRVTGLHFSPGNSTDLFDKVEWAWSHPSETWEMGRAARLEYESRYTAANNYSLLMQIYERTLNRSVPASRVSN